MQGRRSEIDITKIDEVGKDEAANFILYKKWLITICLFIYFTFFAIFLDNTIGQPTMWDDWKNKVALSLTHLLKRLSPLGIGDFCLPIDCVRLSCNSRYYKRQKEDLKDLRCTVSLDKTLDPRTGFVARTLVWEYSRELF